MENEEMNELSKSLFNTIADPFLVISEEGDYLEVLGGTERSLYDEGSALKGRNIYDFLEPEFARFFMEKVNETLRGNSLNCFEYELQTDQVGLSTKNGPGGVQWFEARMYPLPRPYMGHNAVTVMLINISKRKLLDQRLADLSYLDPLTAIANRRFFLERITEELQRFLINRIPVHVLLCDIDRFKVVNDNYGHLAGDFILKEFTEIAKRLFSGSHTIARFGGDEFVISVVGLTTEAVLSRCEELRKTVETHPFDFEGDLIEVRVCIGISKVSTFDNDISKLIGRADKALYEAKETGRNKVVFLP
jgi:diguanylate cyclase (GGDEF)-like protein